MREKQRLDRGPREGTPLKRYKKKVTVSTTIGQVGVNLPLNCNTSQEKKEMTFASRKNVVFIQLDIYSCLSQVNGKVMSYL